MTGELAAAFKSGSQKAGKVTEAWGADNFYCPNCSSPKLDWLKPNTKANDYRCPNCGFWYQLKSKQSRIGNSITDGAYGAMMEAIKNDRTPNFFFLHYDLATWSVRNILLVPHFAFPPSAIIKRNPTTPKGRSQPWIGCNISLINIPSSARISLISEGTILPREEVREKYHQARKQVEGLTAKQRGWRLDVLRVIQSFGKTEFKTSDVYAFDRELEKLHPENRHIRDKIRQQLQVLRDAGLLQHLGSGRWRLP